MIIEQDILRQPPPSRLGVWDEESIRHEVERGGVDYGRTVYVQGNPPNRMWANDPTDFAEVQSKTIHLKK